MFLNKKNRFKPIFKQLFRLRENVQNRKKLLKFEKKKWERLIQHYKRKLKWYKKFKPQNQIQYLVTKYPNKGTGYKKRFRNTLHATKRLNLLYGGFSKKFIKNKIKLTLKRNNSFSKINMLFLEYFEMRLDTILHRAKFSNSIRTARQLIAHGKILVNDKVIIRKNYILKKEDLIKINSKNKHFIEKNLKQTQIWPLPPKYLIINYKTMQIIIGNFEPINLSTSFTFNLQLEKIILNYFKH